MKRKEYGGKVYEVAVGRCQHCAATIGSTLCKNLCCEEDGLDGLVGEEIWREAATRPEEVRDGLRRIAAMCGNPDAAQACRDILAEVKKLEVAE